jgi:hypothetical protein
VCAGGARSLIFFPLNSRLIHLLGGSGLFVVSLRKKKQKTEAIQPLSRRSGLLKKNRKQRLFSRKKNKKKRLVSLYRGGAVSVCSPSAHTRRSAAHSVSAPRCFLSRFFFWSAVRVGVFLLLLFCRTCVFLSSLLSL